MLTLVAVTTLLAADYGTFRANREKEINSDDGWITLVGLSWLKPGENRVGSDASFEVPLPDRAPKRAGVIVLDGKGATFHAAPGVALKSGPMRPDKDILTIDGIKFFVIEREHKLAVRVKDPLTQARKNFTGLKWYPPDPAWKLEAKLVPFAERHTITFDTLAGVKEEMESPGFALFHKDGREFRLDPVLEDGRLFFVFRDQTSGKSTYGGARFLYADPPRNGMVTLDFNEAINPPCVFTPFATCPLPPRQNRLAIEIKAGELMYGQSNHVFP